MSHSVKVVVDVNIVVDLAHEFAGCSTGHRDDLEKLQYFLGREVELHAETVSLQCVVTRHVLRTARTVLGRRYSDTQAEQLLELATRVLLRRGGLYDNTSEDYEELSRRSWLRHGTDTEDEAIVAAAERHHAAVVTNDNDLRQYLDDLRHANWSLASFVRATTKL